MSCASHSCVCTAHHISALPPLLLTPASCLPSPPSQVTQLPSERSYHVFYQLVAGADDHERTAYMLPSDAADFKYLSKSGCLVRG